MKRAAAIALVIFTASVAFSEQRDPRDIVPPAPPKPLQSPPLTVVSPSNIQLPTANPTAVTPQSPAAPQQSKPSIPQPATVDTNVVPSTLTQPLTSGPTQSSPWDKSNALPATAWGATNKNLSAVPATTVSDPWKSTSPPSHNWDTTPGTKTEWK